MQSLIDGAKLAEMAQTIALPPNQIARPHWSGAQWKGQVANGFYSRRVAGFIQLEEDVLRSRRNNFPGGSIHDLRLIVAASLF